MQASVQVRGVRVPPTVWGLQSGLPGGDPNERGLLHLQCCAYQQQHAVRCDAACARARGACLWECAYLSHIFTCVCAYLHTATRDCPYVRGVIVVIARHAGIKASFHKPGPNTIDSDPYMGHT